jgi:hypothetical protein
MAAFLIVVVASGVGTFDKRDAYHKNTPPQFKKPDSLWLWQNCDKVKLFFAKIEQRKIVLRQRGIERDPDLSTPAHIKQCLLHMKRYGLSIYQIFRAGTRAMRLPNLPELRSARSIASHGRDD